MSTKTLNIRVNSSHLKFEPEERVYFFNWNKIRFVLDCKKIDPSSVYRLEPLEKMFTRKNVDFVFFLYIFHANQLYHLNKNFTLYRPKSKIQVDLLSLCRDSIFSNNLKKLEDHQETLFRLTEQYSQDFLATPISEIKKIHDLLLNYQK